MGEFVAWVCLMILSNAVFIGLTTDRLIKRSISAYESQGTVPAKSSVIDVFEVFFTISFAIELLLRLVALEGRFCVGVGGRWNLFDAVLVGLSFVDMFLAAATVNFTF